MRNISFPVSGFLIIKSPNPKFSRKAISKSAGSCFEFLLKNAHFNSFTAASLAISLDSMIIGRNGSLAFSSFANLRPALGIFGSIFCEGNVRYYAKDVVLVFFVYL